MCCYGIANYKWALSAPILNSIGLFCTSRIIALIAVGVNL